jgi:gas vesicle protein
MIAAALPVAGFAMSGMAQAIGSLYSVTGDISSWMDKHIQDMQASDNLTISRTGKVLEGAKLGFGLGYTVPVTVIAVGQFLLGNTLAAITTMGTAATFTNPIAMTCAAVGAIYYGWNALSDDERADALDKLSNGLEIGIELIKSVIRYVVDGLSNLMTSKHLVEFKEFISEGAKRFGKTLYDVTHDLTDKLSKLWSGASASVSVTVEKSKETIKESSESVIKSMRQIKDGATSTIDEATALIKGDCKK